MKYIIFTDGSCSTEERKITSSFFIRTKKDFITLGCETLDGDSIAAAETIAIGFGIEALMCEVDIQPEDKVLIRTDCESTLTFFENVKDEDGRPKSKDTRCKKAWWMCRDLSSKCDVEIRKIQAHRDEVNGNKVADRIAKYFLRFNSL